MTNVVDMGIQQSDMHQKINRIENHVESIEEVQSELSSKYDTNKYEMKNEVNLLSIKNDGQFRRIETEFITN